MTRPLRFRDPALADTDGQYLHFGRESAVLAERFLSALREAIRRISQLPLAGSPLTMADPRLRGIRSWAVPGFEDVRVFYRVRHGGVEVLRVLHGARDIPRLLRNEEE